MSSLFSSDSCVICHILFDDGHGSEKPVRVVAGREKLLSSSIKRGHSDLAEYLSSAQHEINVHESCRKRYINEASIQLKRGACADEAEGQCKILRSYVVIVIVIVISKLLKRYSKAKRTRAPAYSRALRRIKGGFPKGGQEKLRSEFQS